MRVRFAMEHHQHRVWGERRRDFPGRSGKRCPPQGGFYGLTFIMKPAIKKLLLLVFVALPVMVQKWVGPGLDTNNWVTRQRPCPCKCGLNVTPRFIM